MLAELKKVRFPVETGLLIAFCLFLPLVEAPKNLAWLGYVAVWLLNRSRAGELGAQFRASWDGWDSLFALWIVTGYLAAAFSGLRGGELSGAHELARYALLGWMVKRGGYSAKEIHWVLGALVLSLVAGLAFGYWRLWSGAGKSGTLQLYSVGHVNHTAIYIAIMFGVCASWLFTCWRAWTTGRRVLALAVCLLALVSLIVTASRGAIGVGLVLLLVLGAAWWPRWRAAFIASLAVVALVAASLVTFETAVIRKQEVYVATQNVLSGRDGIWRMALVAWERYPWFGVGMNNYKQISHERVRTWRAEAGKDYDAARYMEYVHAHNLFVNALAERGIVGFAALAAVLLAWFAVLIRRRPRAQDGELAWLVWGGAASAWFVTVMVGMVNTTLHHEHGLLAALLLGLWLSTLSIPRPQRAS
ncbi:MAG: O-antigen ligase family protein [Betaproteobacteria bacterium]|nr:O-antigen ligase family protein [Betaproteobacteria bacterium]